MREGCVLHRRYAPDRRAANAGMRRGEAVLEVGVDVSVGVERRAVDEDEASRMQIALEARPLAPDELSEASRIGRKPRRMGVVRMLVGGVARLAAEIDDEEVGRSGEVGGGRAVVG